MGNHLLRYRRLRLQRCLLVIAAVSAMVLTFQNCSFNKVQTSSSVRADSRSQGGTGADGKLYVSYDSDCGKEVSPSTAISMRKDQSAKLVRENCVDLPDPRPVLPEEMKFAYNDNTLFSLNGKIFDLHTPSGGQRLTLEFCQSSNSTSPLQTQVWQTIGSSDRWYGRIQTEGGADSGVLNMLAPVAGFYQTTTGQSSQFALLLSTGGSGQLNYKMGSAAAKAEAVSCLSQSPPLLAVDDGSSSAPAGAAPRPDLLNGYAARPAWKVAAVDYGVGVPAGLALKDPLADPAIVSNAKLSLDTSNRILRIRGDDVILDGYDFSLNGGYEITMESGSNAKIRNSRLLIVGTAAAARGLTIENCTLDPGGASGRGWTVINHSGRGLTVMHSWLRNFPNHGIEANNGGGEITLKYNLIETGGLKSGGFFWLQLGGNAPYTSVVVEFNTLHQAAAVSNGEGIKFYWATSITGNISYNTMLATGPSTSMNYMVHVGGGSQFPGTVNADVHDNYMDLSAAAGPFYVGVNNDGNTRAIYSNNKDLVSGKLISADP